MQKGEHVCSYLALFAIISDKRFQHHTTSARQYQPPVLGLHGGSKLEPRVMSNQPPVLGLHGGSKLEPRVMSIMRASLLISGIVNLTKLLKQTAETYDIRAVGMQKLQGHSPQAIALLLKSSATVSGSPTASLSAPVTTKRSWPHEVSC